MEGPNCCTIVGWDSIVGDWSRVEGTPDDPNPNKPFAKMENNPLFNSAGKGGSSRTTAKCLQRGYKDPTCVLPHCLLSKFLFWGDFNTVAGGRYGLFRYI